MTKKNREAAARRPLHHTTSVFHCFRNFCLIILLYFDLLAPDASYEVCWQTVGRVGLRVWIFYRCSLVDVVGVQSSQLDNFFCIPERKLHHWQMEATHQGSKV